MITKIAIVGVLASGCAAEPARWPTEQEGLPLIMLSAAPVAAAEAPPRTPTTPLDAEACRSLRIAPAAARHGIVGPEAVERAFSGAAPALREAVCACPPRQDEAWLLVTSTPDRGAITARGREPDAPIDACLAARLRGVTLPRWHLGSDCIGCGPRRFGVLRGSPPVDGVPADGVATLTFLVGVAR